MGHHHLLKLLLVHLERGCLLLHIFIVLRFEDQVEDGNLRKDTKLSLNLAFSSINFRLTVVLLKGLLNVLVEPPLR